MLSEATGRTTPLEALGEVRALGILRRGILTLLETGLQVQINSSPLEFQNIIPESLSQF